MADQAITTSFLAYHYPALQAGAFVIEQEMLMPSGLSDKQVEIPVAKQYFVVSGERFYIAPDQVFAVFPPKGSEGDYAGCLPHIELKRSTLPWERSAAKEKGGDPASAPTPWLALLLVSESDVEQEDVVPLSIKAEDYISRYGLTQEPVSLQQTEEINILQCKKEYLDKLIAAPEEWSLLSHVRKVLKQDRIAMEHIPDERAVIVSRRMPEPGNSYTVHLVSLEERYHDGKFVSKPDAQQSDWLVSLYSWRFTSSSGESYKADALALSKLKQLQAQNEHVDKLYEVLSSNLARYGNAPLFRSKERFRAYLQEENIFPGEIDSILTASLPDCFRYEAGTLRSLLNNLQVGPLRLSLQQAGEEDKAVSTYLDLGSVPLSHHLRAGGHTVSWYRGPFVAFDAAFEDDRSKMLTHQHADELIQFNKDTGLLDMTYAAAWELGRLMFINEPKLVQQLQLWKQEHNFDELLEKQRAEHAHLMGFIAQPKNESLPAPIVNFLLQSFRFINFPFNYLVPDNRMLPKESLRFFKVDEIWLRCFLYGVISVGERISFQKTGDIVDSIREQLIQQVQDIIKDKDYHTNEENAIYGMLVNSDAIAGWPALQVEAYRTLNGARKQVALLHKRYLSENVTLCLFYGKMDQIVFYLPMGASHFGFDLGKDGYSKVLTDGKTIIGPFTGSIINARELATRMKADNAGSFAVELLHKQDMVTFEMLPG